MSDAPEREEGQAGEPRIPTKKEIAQLPRWAQVAFAARCARRVQPLFRHFWPRASKEHVEAVDRAVTLTQAAAANPASVSEGELSAAASAANAASAAAVAAVAAVNVVAYAAASAANAASAATAAYTALDAAAAVRAANAVHAANAVIRRDFGLVREAAQREAWTDDTSVPPEFFGPLWPEGVPEGWPEDTTYDRAEQAIELRVALPPMPDSPEAREALKQRIGAVLKTANAVHLASGGSGLRIAKASVETTAGARKKVGS